MVAGCPGRHPPCSVPIPSSPDAERRGRNPPAAFALLCPLPPGYGPQVGQVVVPTPEALDLVKYMQGLDHTYPVLPAPAKTAER